MSKRLLSITEVNAMSGDEFLLVFGNVVELCPLAALRVSDKRPFASASQLCDAFAHYLYSISEDERIKILCLHPELSAPSQDPEDLTPESTNEQAAAGLTAVTITQRLFIQDYNRRYKAKFGFPFIICARENSVSSIMDALATRYSNSHSKETATAIDEVIKICKLRILDVVKND